MSRSDDRKMKELVDRLVAMSPEPPPFPEEVSVTQREESSKMRPILVFAGAALVVLLAAGIPLLLARGGGEVDPVATSTSTTVASTVTTVPEATTTTGAAPTTTAPAVTTTQPAPTTTTPSEDLAGVFIFLTQSPENSFTGNPALVPFVTNAVPGPGENPVAVALTTLFNPVPPPPGFDNQAAQGITVESVEEPSETLRVVDLSENFLEGSVSGGALGDFTMLNQMIYTTLGYHETFIEVLFTVNGEPVTSFGSEGLDISEPLTKQSFLDQLNSINLESAITGIGEFPATIDGIANVFEATVSLDFVDSDGNIVYEDFTTASCGTGCWGNFSFLVEDFDFAANPVTVQVFWNSAEDGSPVDVVSVPSSWGDEPWDFVNHPGTP